MKSPISTVIDSVIAHGPTRYLRSYGYRKQVRSFFKQADDIFQVINFQAGRGNTPQAGDLTINLSLTFPYFHEIWAGTAFPSNPGSAAQILSWRIGHLLPSAQDKWWTVIAQSDLSATSNEIVKLLEEQAIPFLDQKANMESIREILEHGGRPADGVLLSAKVCLAIVLCYLGEREQARQVLDEQRQTTKLKHFVETIDLIEQRLGL